MSQTNFTMDTFHLNFYQYARDQWNCVHRLWCAHIQVQTTALLLCRYNFRQYLTYSSPNYLVSKVQHDNIYLCHKEWPRFWIHASYYVTEYILGKAGMNIYGSICVSVYIYIYIWMNIYGNIYVIIWQYMYKYSVYV